MNLLGLHVVFSFIPNALQILESEFEWFFNSQEKQLALWLIQNCRIKWDFTNVIRHNIPADTDETFTPMNLSFGQLWKAKNRRNRVRIGVFVSSVPTLDITPCFSRFLGQSHTLLPQGTIYRLVSTARSSCRRFHFAQVDRSISLSLPPTRRDSSSFAQSMYIYAREYV